MAFHRSRRALMLGVLALGACATTTGGGGVTLGIIQKYAADVVAAFKALVPTVTALDPSLGAELTTIASDAQTALDALTGVTSISAGKSLAQTIVSVITTGLSIAAPLLVANPAAEAAILAAQALLPLIAGFFGVAPVAATLSLERRTAAAGWWTAARARFDAAPDKAAFAAAADAQLRAWLAAR